MRQTHRAVACCFLATQLCQLTRWQAEAFLIVTELFAVKLGMYPLSTFHNHEPSLPNMFDIIPDAIFFISPIRELQFE